MEKLRRPHRKRPAKASGRRASGGVADETAHKVLVHPPNGTEDRCLSVQSQQLLRAPPPLEEIGTEDVPLVGERRLGIRDRQGAWAVDLVASLPDPLDDIAEWKFLRNASYDTIAREFRIAVSEARRLVARAETLLRRRMEELDNSGLLAREWTLRPWDKRALAWVKGDVPGNLDAPRNRELRLVRGEFVPRALAHPRVGKCTYVRGANGEIWSVNVQNDRSGEEHSTPAPQESRPAALGRCDAAESDDATEQQAA
jgi:hypothetical protein